MTPRFKLGVVFVSTLLTLMLVVGSLIGRGQESDGAYRPLAVYTEVLAKIKSDYVEEPNMDKVTNGALQGLVEFLDPQSSCHLRRRTFPLFPQPIPQESHTFCAIRQSSLVPNHSL